MRLAGAETGRLGGYRLLERIGSGAGATVYRAEDSGGRSVAIKELHHDIAQEPAARRRLEGEAAALSRISSEHVVRLLGHDFDGGRPFIVLDHVPGKTLEDMADAYGPVGDPVLTEFARRLAEGLAAIHAQGIVHRDLKPGNVMIEHGTAHPKVIDFGISHAFGAGADTQPGILVGTPSYLAPELVDPGDGSATSASDVFSWAATVAFAATGRPPFGSGSPHAVCFRILRGAADLAGVPGPLAELLRLALRRAPAERPSAAWLAWELGTRQR